MNAGHGRPICRLLRARRRALEFVVHRSAHASACFFVSSMLLVAWAAIASAQDKDVGGVTLSWEAPAGCPSEAFVRDRIRAVVGDAIPPMDRVQADISVRQAEGGAWRLTLMTRQGAVHGQRAFEADSCVAVAEAAALVIAMMLDPDARLESPSGPASAPTAAPSTKPLAPVSQAPSNPPKPREPSSVAMSVSPALLLDWGSLPAATLGVGGVWRVGSPQYSWEFQGAWWPARRATFAEHPSSGVEVGLLAAGGQGCVGIARTPVLRVCAGAEIGSLSADAFGVSRTQAARPFWGGLTAAGIATIPFDAISMWMQVGGVAPWTRPRIVVSPYGEAFRPAALALRASVGVAYTF